jgi:GT2 family glycosyltransferase
MNKVIVIILNWNGQKYIKRCIDSIFELTEHDYYDVCVVDNGSVDRSVNIVRNKFEEVNIIENNKNLGFSIGNNVGICANEGYDYYTLLNSDTQVKRGWLRKIMEIFEENEDAGICGSKILNEDGTIQSAGVDTKRLVSLREDRGEDERKYKKVDGVLGASFTIDSDLVEQIGYLDEVYSPLQHEESDYCCRARKIGYSVYLAYESEVVHYGGRAKENIGSSFEMFCEFKNKLKFRIMNDTIRSVLSLLYKHTRLVLLSILEDRREYSKKAYFEGIMEVLYDIPGLIKKRLDRSSFVPSYYCENSYDYSERYT